MTGKIIGVISIKGGVGKTTTILGLGAALAQEFNKKVLLVDANFSSPHLALYLGFTKPELTLHNVLNTNRGAEEAVYTTKYGFHIMPGSIANDKKIDPFKLRSKINLLRKYYDFILIDSSPSLNHEILATMVASDALFVVTTPDHVTLSSTIHAVKIAKQKKTPIYGLILNKVHNKKFELSLKEIEYASRCNVLAVLPYELNVLDAVSKRIPVTLYKESDLTVEFKNLAAALVGGCYKDPRKLARLKNIFRKETPKQEMNRTFFGNRGLM